MSESDPRTAVLADPRAGAPWPRDPASFGDTTRCPACFTAVTAVRCTACGLDLTMPRLAEVLENGRGIERLVAERAALIDAVRADQVRAENAAREARLAEAASSRAAAQSTPVARPVTAPQTASAPASASVPAPARPLAHRFSMQFTILGVGVILTSVGAVVFLLWAYLVVGLEVRSMIIAGASAGVLALAWFLRRRGLVLTGEGVGVVAIVFLMLDAWIIRANHAFGSGTIDALAYYGGAALVVAALLAAARRLTALRVTGYAAAGLVPLGVALLAAALAPHTGSTRWWAAGLAALAAGIVGARLLPRSPALWVMLAGGAVIGLAAIGGAFDALPGMRGHALIAFGAAAALWGGLAWATRGRADARLRAIPAAFAGLSAAAAPAVAAAQELSFDVSGWLAPVGAAAVTCALVLVAMRSRAAAPATGAPSLGDEPGAQADAHPDTDAVADADADAAMPENGDAAPAAPLGRLARASVWTATAVTIVAALPGLVVGISRIAGLVVAGFSGWQASPVDAVVGQSFGGAGAAVAPLALAAVAAAILVARRRLDARAVVPAGLAAWAALVAATYPTPWWAMGAFAAIAAASIALGLVVPRRALVVLLAVAEGASAALLLALAGAVAPVWPASVALFLAVALAGFFAAWRTWGGNAARRSRIVHLAVAATAAGVCAGLIPAWAATTGAPITGAWADPWMWVTACAAAVLAIVVACRALPTTETWAASAPALAASVAGLGGLLGSPASVAWVPTLALALVAGAGVALDRRAPLRTSLAAIAPVSAGIAAWNALPLLAIDQGYRPVTVGAVLLLLAGAGLLIRLPHGASTALAWFVSIGAVGAVTVATAAGTEQSWLVLLLAAPIPFLAAAVTGDPVAGASPWRHVAWLTPALGLAALWTALGRSGATLVEAYTMPTAAVLAGLSILLAVRRPHAADGTAGRIALAWAGAATAVLPSVLASADPALRPILTACAGVIALTVSPWCVARWRAIPVRLLATAAGGGAVVGAAAVHGTALAVRGDWSADVWATVALVGGLTAALLLARTPGVPRSVPGAAAGLTIVAAAVPPSVLAAHPSLPVWLLLAPVAVLGFVHAATALPRLAPLSDPIARWTALVALALVGVVTVVLGGADPFDPVPVVVGLSLVAAGILGRRSTLAWAGAAVGILPSVVASTDPVLRPLVLVGVGIVLLGAARVLPTTFRDVPVRAIAVSGGAAATVGAAGVRGTAVALAPSLALADPWGAVSWIADVWGAVALLGGLAAALLLERLAGMPRRTAPWVAAGAIAVATLPAIVLATQGTLPAPVLLAPIVVLSVLHVAVALIRSGPLARPLVGWTAAGAAIVVGVVTLARGSVDPFDLVTATIGVAMAAAGLVRMRRTPALRSWPALGPGLAVLLVPSLLADYVDPVPWRLVALGVAGVAVMLFGAFRRMQAPFLLGAGVLVVHGLTQLWPVIARNYGQVWWWLWLAIAGVVLIAIAATYERQLRAAKRAIRTVASLR